MAEPQRQQHVQPAPAPFTWDLDRVGHAETPSGDRLPVIQVHLVTPSAEMRLFATAPEWQVFIDQLRECALGGLTIATQLPDEP